MKKVCGLVLLCMVSTFAFAQKEREGKSISVPVIVKNGLSKKYPSATKITWEKENGNYEANWGGKEGEDNSVLFTPAGDFVEIINLISVNHLPAPVLAYLRTHYKGAKITEAGKVTDAKGKIFYEAEVKRKDIVFDEKGNFIKVE